MNIQRILMAVDFALRAHGKQKRKYTGENYVCHTLEVARIVEHYGGTENMVIASILHDVDEDTNFTIQDIEEKFGKEVADLVEALTDVSKLEDGNRETRKAIDREHSAKASAEAQTIKVADLISNTRSIADHDKVFAKIYLEEKEKLLEVLTKADPLILEAGWHAYHRAKSIVDNSKHC